VWHNRQSTLCQHIPRNAPETLLSDSHVVSSVSHSPFIAETHFWGCAGLNSPAGRGHTNAILTNRLTSLTKSDMLSKPSHSCALRQHHRARNRPPETIPGRVQCASNVTQIHRPGPSDEHNTPSIMPTQEQCMEDEQDFHYHMALELVLCLNNGWRQSSETMHNQQQ